MALRRRPALRLALCGAVLIQACAEREPSAPMAPCAPGTVTACSCVNTSLGERVCGPDGTYGACTCGAPAEQQDAATLEAGMPPGSDGAPPSAPDAQATPSADSGGPNDDAGSGEPEAPAEGLEALRELCVATINMHRATLGLPPLARASASEENCSDQGAKLDHDTGRAHGSAAAGALACRSYGVAQNTCPDYPYGGFYGTPAQAMVRCLQQMWDEGEPAVGIDQCIADYFAGKTACFLAHGHYINMVSTKNRTVSCGFHDSGRTMWMNQDFR